MLRTAEQMAAEVPPTLSEVRAAVEKRLFIGSVPSTATEVEVRQAFGGFGNLVDCQVLASQNAAFVGFGTWGAAHRALRATDGVACLASCAGAPLSVSFAERLGCTPGTGARFLKGMELSRVFVSGLPAACAEDEVRRLFEGFGHVVAAVLQAPQPASPVRCGLVAFSLWGEALDAMERLDGQPYPGSLGEPMKLVLAQPQPLTNGAKHQRLDAPAGPPAPGVPGLAVDAAAAAVLPSAPAAASTAAPPPPPPPPPAAPGAGPGAAPFPVAGAVPPPPPGAVPPPPPAAPAVAVAPAPAPAAAPAAALAAAAAAALGGDAQLEGLKAAYVAAVDGDMPDEVCRELHLKIMAERPWNKLHGQGAPAPPGPPASSASSASGGASQQLIISGFPVECKEGELKSLIDQVEFSCSAEQKRLLECQVQPGQGCAFLRFASQEAAQEAIRLLNERAVSGWPSPLRVGWASPPAPAAAQPPRDSPPQPQPQPQGQQQLLQLLQLAASAEPPQQAGAAAEPLGGALHGLLAGLASTGAGGGLQAASAAEQQAATALQAIALQSLLASDPAGAQGSQDRQSAAALQACALQSLLAGAPGGAAAQPAATAAQRVVALNSALAASPEEASVAMQGLDPKRLFVGQLRRELSDKAQLSRIFEPFGQVDSIRWLEDKGVAYVQYADFASANAALLALNGKDVSGVSTQQGLNVAFSKVR